MVYIGALLRFAIASPLLRLIIASLRFASPLLIYKLSFAMFYLCSIPLPVKLSFIYRASHTLMLCFVPLLYISV